MELSQHVEGMITTQARRHRVSMLAYIVEWWRRSRSRRELLTLDDHDLNDIGIGRSSARIEGTKFFWQE